MELENGAERIQGLATAAVPKLVQSVKKADDKLVAFIVERPVAALCVALAFGYTVGRIVSNRG